MCVASGSSFDKWQAANELQVPTSNVQPQSMGKCSPENKPFGLALLPFERLDGNPGNLTHAHAFCQNRIATPKKCFPIGGIKQFASNNLPPINYLK